MSGFRAAQLVDEQFEESEFESSDSDLLQCALIKLIEDHRPVLAHALIKGFGSEMKLLEAMEASIAPARDADDPEDAEHRTVIDPDRGASHWFG